MTRIHDTGLTGPGNERLRTVNIPTLIPWTQLEILECMTYQIRASFKKSRFFVATLLRMTFFASSVILSETEGSASRLFLAIRPRTEPRSKGTPRSALTTVLERREHVPAVLTRRSSLGKASALPMTLKTAAGRRLSITLSRQLQRFVHHVKNRLHVDPLGFTGVQILDAFQAPRLKGHIVLRNIGAQRVGRAFGGRRSLLHGELTSA